jgi:hypothetical protein
MSIRRETHFDGKSSSDCDGSVGEDRIQAKGSI